MRRLIVPVGLTVAVAVIVALVGVVAVRRGGRDRERQAAWCADPVGRPSASTGRGVAPVGDPTEGTGAPGGGDESGPPTFGSMAGIAAGGYMLACDSDRTLARDLDVIAATGARWVRFDFDWQSAEPTRGRFAWEGIDRVVTGARARGLRILATLAYTPPWARPPGTTDKTPPTDPATYAAFAGAAAARYGPQGVHAWEIWNEPNTSEFWKPHPDIGAYTALLERASAAIRSHDPSATIVTAGLAPAVDARDATSVAPRTFLTGIYGAGAASSFDAVGIHPYDYPYGAFAEGDWNQFWSLPETYRVMVNHGDGAKKLWATEYGAPTGTAPSAVSPDAQARFVREGFEQWASKPYTGPLFWYSHRDNTTDPTDPGANFGLVANDFTPKPALATFTSLMRESLPPSDAAASQG